MRGCGCLLIVLAVAALLVIIVVPVLPFWEENTTIDGFLQPLLCQSGEDIQRRLYSEPARGGGTSFSMDVYCIDEEDQRRDETGRWALIGGGAFTVLLLAGMAAFAMGGRGSTNVGGMETGAPLASAGFFGSATPPSAGTGATLSARLKQLEDARNAGLISADEYERLRQEILKGGV